MKFYTIGYGGKKPEAFLDLLKERGIRAIVDVRLRPDHARLGWYARTKSPDKGIESLLKSAGIEYHSLVELGNIFLNYDDWQDRYGQLLVQAGYLLVEKLERISVPFCLLCAEREAADCHRKLIADYLEQKGYQVEHLGQLTMEELHADHLRRSSRNPIPRTYVTDIQHFLDRATGEFPDSLPSPALKMAIFQTQLIGVATEKFPADWVLTSVRCKRRGCLGDILVWCMDLNETIEWGCPECNDGGFISNWRGTKWDKTPRGDNSG